MQKLVVALMMLSLFSCARAASASPHTDAVSAALVKARFDRALPALEKCREEREQGHALICAHMHAAILKNQGNGREWARSMMFLRGTAHLTTGTDAAELSRSFAGVDFQAIAALPPYALTWPDSNLVIPTLAADAAAGTRWSGSVGKSYLVRIKTEAGHSVAMVDTGAPAALSMSGRTADALGIKRVVATIKGTAMLLDADIPVHQEELRFAEHVRIGPIELRNVLVQVNPRDQEYGAIIGMGLLAKFSNVSFTEGEIAFDQPRPIGSKSAPFKFAHEMGLGASLVIFNVDTQGAVRKAMFDTGLTALMAYTSELAVRTAGEVTSEDPPDVGGRRGIPYKFSRQSASFNGVNLIDAPTVLLWKSPRTLPFEVMLGGQIQKSFNAQIDFENGNLYFWPPTAEQQRLVCGKQPKDEGPPKDNATYCG